MPSERTTSNDVTVPSVGALAYQAATLQDELEKISEPEFPGQACLIKDVLLCLVRRIVEEYRLLLDEENKGNVDIDRVQKLGMPIGKIYSYIRYLRASSPKQTPPGIQLAIAQLTRKFFPSENGEPVCLVRPQWSYNLGYVDLSVRLEEMIELNVLNRRQNPAVKTPKEFLPALWSSEQQEKPFPKQLAVLSFAGLDTNDVLLYPILAHELGHFIDYSFRPNHRHLSPEIYQAAGISPESIQAQLGLEDEEADDLYAELIERAYVCFREIIADLLAARMMGLSFFVSQAEYLKALSEWPGSLIGPSGYPGLKFRLSIVYRHLASLPENNSFAFLKENDHPDTAGLKRYLSDWDVKLERDLEKESPIDPNLPIELRGDLFLENSVRRALPSLTQIVQAVIKNSHCARLSKKFFHRITSLKNDLPPSCSTEDSQAFSEIFSAAWAYQLQYSQPFNADSFSRRTE